MHNHIKFSIIIPTYNRGYMIRSSINSVLNQNYKNFELIIIDDGSEDDTRAIVAEFKDSKIKYHYKVNEERGVARNTGMEVATGDYITFVDSDDILYPSHFEHASTKLTELGHPHFYRQAYEVKDEKGKILFANDKVKGDANRFILQGNYFSCIGIFLKKEITKEVKFNPDRFLSPSEDWDYWLRLSVRYKFYYDNTVTACMLQHQKRSLCSFDEKKSRLAIGLLIKSLKRDKTFMLQRAEYIDQIRAQMYSLLCLNKILHHKTEGIGRDILKTIKLSKKQIFTRRTLAIIKYYLLTIINK